MIIKTNSCIIQGGSGTSGLPIEIDNETDMLAVLNDSSNEGKYYLYTGTTTATFTNGQVYQCYNDSSSVY